MDFAEIKTIFSLLMDKYEKIFKQKPDFLDQNPTIASKITLKSEIPQKMNPSQNYEKNSNSAIKSTMLAENKNNAVNYKNYSVQAFSAGNSAGNTVQSKHYNYPKPTSSILTVGQFNYLRFGTNNNF